MIFSLIVLLIILVDLTPVQNFLAGKAADMLSRKLKTKVAIAHVRIDFLDHLLLQGLYIEDQSHDTLLYAGEAQLRITDWFILKDNVPVLHYLGLHHAKVHLYRTSQSKVWNYQFIADAFQAGPKKKKTTNNKEFELDLKKIDIADVHFYMDDAWSGDDMDYDVGSLKLDADRVDFKKKILDVNTLAIEGAHVILRDYNSSPLYQSTHTTANVIDTTAFNPDKWDVKMNKLSLKNCLFSLTSDTLKPAATEFDPAHLYISNIAINANHIHIVGDTIHGNLDHLAADERCGIRIKEMHSKITVSPNASICENLYLETNNSKLTNYYAMRYTRFPDFTSYIDKVVMEGHLKNAVVDGRDIAYFAPQLRQYPALLAQLKVSGDAKGTVADLTAKNMQLTDGYSVMKGNVHMKGLPDIYKTRIDYDNGELLTTGIGILKYAPSLKNNPDVAIEKIKYAYFKGSYTGFIENFAVNGAFSTNLGNIAANVKMSLPGFNVNTASYSGTIKGQGVNIGAFLRQPDLGIISLSSTVNGNAFDPDHAQITFNADISEFEYRGYDYHNILANGVLARKQFTGSLQVDDPNLALAFNGNVNFSQKQVTINANANLLKSDFRALHLTTDTVLANADFDLNCRGSNIDNFSGYAKLYNIDIKRNQHRLNLDSIYVNSIGDSVQKTLTIQSNDIVATIKGAYQLSKLPYSIQYYMSGYLPNYIKAPAKYAPEQDLTFNITTTRIDSLLGVIIPSVRGFDSSSVSGSLNTRQQKLTLAVRVPYGSIGNIHMTNIAINGDGNFKTLGLNTQVDDVAIGDSILNGSLSVTTTLGNDSLRFTIATESAGANGSVTLNGEAYARRDSLFLSLQQSKFMLNQAQWDIPAGNQVVYSNKYLMVQNLVMQSGLQRITANTTYNNREQTLSISTQNLDLGQLGAWAGLAVYQPDGRLNGSITINNIFDHPYISADIKATDVKLGADTLGDINIMGTYDGAKKLAILDPQTGVYRGDASIVVGGSLSFDSTTNQKLDGNIQFNNAPAAWTSSFLTGFMSHLSGTLNGTVTFSGTTYSPDISGSVAVRDAGVHIDFLGTDYTIPNATVSIDNHRIDVGEVTMYDRFKNTATLSGYFSHNLFKDMRMRLAIRSNKFEVFNLHSYENQIFYGNLVAGVDSATIRGPFNDISIRIVNAVPAAKSQIYIPVETSGSTGTYNYVSFKTYGKLQEKVANRNKSKLAIEIDANMNDLAEMTLVLDPTTGDAITARGTGAIKLEIPASNDVRMFGTYNIDEGRYIFTFKQLSIHREFVLNPESYIQFNGLLAQTSMNVDATYTAKTRLYDLLSDAEKAPDFLPKGELADAQTPQNVNVLLHMKGSLGNPKLTFNIDLTDKHSVGTYAYTKLQRINQDDQQLFEQVAALLLIGDFIAPEGVAGNTAVSGALNNVGQVVSGAASTQITNLVNKITGNKDVSIDLKYSNYNLSDPTLGGINRNQLSVGVRKNYFHDRLVVEVGSTSDWGHPANTSNASTFNIAGDFRIQYLLNQSGGLRLSGFRTSDYDVTLDRDISIAGIGLSWRKNFDGLREFIHGSGRVEKAVDKTEPAADSARVDSVKRK